MFYVIQFGFFLAAIASGIANANFTWPFRNLSFHPDSKVSEFTKAELSKAFHQWGFISTLIFCLTASVSAFFLQHGTWWAIKHYLLWAVTGGLIYGTVFNITYAVCVLGWKDWFYLGSTATTDSFLVSKLGKFAGVYVALASVVLIGIFNLLN